MITETEALEQGLREYDSTSMCKRGHTGKRTVLRGSCVECDKQRNAARKRSTRDLHYKQLGNMANHPLYSVYRAMMNRCYNSSTSCWHNYGGLGVTVCDRWKQGDEMQRGFWYFVADMGDRPAHTSIDRIDAGKGYYPENCRWATQEEQIKNRRRYGTVNPGPKRDYREEK